MPDRRPAPTIDDILMPEGILHAKLPGYEYRAEQVEVCRVIEQAFQTGQHGLVEAGTGVGKTLAYLIPAVRAAALGKRTVLSTHTISLQSQLMAKDIPLVTSLFRDDKGKPLVDVKAVLMKGRGNYLCHQDMDAASADLFNAADPLFRELKTWARNTDTGDVADQDFVYPHWHEIAANQDTCRGKECSYYDRCFYFRMRWNATDAQLIVVNHALFFSDLALRAADPESGILPDYDYVVLDEAHHLEDVATRVFGLEITSRQIPRLVDRVRRTRDIDIDETRLAELDRLNEELFRPFQQGTSEFFYAAAVCSPEIEQGVKKEADEVCERLGILTKDLLRKAESADGPLRDRLQGLSNIASHLHQDLRTLILQPEENYIRWGEHTAHPPGALRGQRAEPRTTLYHTPLEVGGLLREMLWDRVESAVLTSATLANSGGFTYLRARLGIPDNTIERVVGSPFDFKKQALLYVPGHLPPPAKSPDPDYVEAIVKEIERLLELSQGRAFLLFTSRRMMNEVYDRIKDRLPFPLFRQGEMPPGKLIEAFRESGSGVVFGLQTFWEGVDVRGDALSCVVIDRLPFAVPDSPITRARTDAITQAGGDWFNEFSIPQAQIRLKQGFGRLIRTHQDRGIVCILDTRLITKRYGKEFVQHLPPATRASLWSRVERFWKSDENAVPESVTPGRDDTKENSLEETRDAGRAGDRDAGVARDDRGDARGAEGA